MGIFRCAITHVYFLICIVRLVCSDLYSRIVFSDVYFPTCIFPMCILFEMCFPSCISRCIFSDLCCLIYTCPVCICLIYIFGIVLIRFISHDLHSPNYIFRFVFPYLVFPICIFFDLYFPPSIFPSVCSDLYFVLSICSFRCLCFLIRTFRFDLPICGYRITFLQLLFSE